MKAYVNGTAHPMRIRYGSCSVNDEYWGSPCDTTPGLSPISLRGAQNCGLILLILLIKYPTEICRLRRGNGEGRQASGLYFHL